MNEQSVCSSCHHVVPIVLSVQPCCVLSECTLFITRHLRLFTAPEICIYCTDGGNGYYNGESSVNKRDNVIWIAVGVAVAVVGVLH